MKLISKILFIILFNIILFLIYVTIFVFRILLIHKYLIRKKTAVLYFENFPIENAGYQNRAKKWAKKLQENGYKAKVWTTTKSKLKFEKQIEKQFKFYLLRTIILRYFQIISSITYKKIIVRRELLLYNNYGNLFMEKLLFSVHKTENVILDFDDDIVYSKKEGYKKTVFGKILLENNYKFSDTLKIYQNFIVCSKYLSEFVNKINAKAKITIIPTCVEVQNTTKKYLSSKTPISLIWVGGNGNQKYLDDIVPELNNVKKIYDIELIVVSGKNYINKKAQFPIVNKKWTLKKQYEYIKQADIGIMPLRNTDEDKGKCAFKLLQYMSMGLVSLTNGITINNEIIEQGKNGFLVDESWSDSLIKLIEKRDSWSRIGIEAQETIKKYYSFTSNTEKYIKCVE